MELIGIITRSLQADTQAELRDIERAVAPALATPAARSGPSSAGKWRALGSGRRLANSWRDRHHPN